MKMAISVGRCLKRKTMLVWVKEYIIKSFSICKILCTLQELYNTFKEKHPNVNIVFSKLCALRPKWCVLAGSEITHSVWVCSAHQNFVLLVDAMDWDLTHKAWSRRFFATLRATNASCIGVNPVLALQLWKNVLIKSSTNIKMMRTLITVSGILQIEQQWQPLQPFTENTKRLWLMLLMI